jgi:uncharacterized protein involved in exopolysaccharide biosynthesis
VAELIAAREREEAWGARARAVWSRRRWLAAFCLAVPLAATLCAAAFLPDRYRSAALVVVARSPLAGVPGPAEGPTSTEAHIQRLHEENLSRSHLQALLDESRLYPELVQKAPEAAIEQMRRDIRIEAKDAEHAGGRSLVAFQISFRGRDAEGVAQVTNALASFYADRSRAEREHRAKSAIALLEAEVAQVKKLLDEQAGRVNEFIALHLHELPEQVPLNLATLERLNALLLRERGVRGRPLPERAREGSAQPPEGIDPQRAELAERLRALRARFTDAHPDVAALKAQIALLEASEPHRAAPERAPAPRREGDEQVAERIAATEKKIVNAPRRERELEMLLAPYQATRQLYGSLVARLEEARLAVASERQQAVDPVRVLDAAVTARDPVAPNRVRLLAAGAIATLIFAAAVVLLAERLDTSFHSLDDLRAFTRVPVLASVPEIVARRDRARRRRRAGWTALLLALAVAASGAGTYALVHENDSLVRMLARGV